MSPRYSPDPLSDDNDVTDIDLHLYNSDGSVYDKDDPCLKFKDT